MTDQPAVGFVYDDRYLQHNPGIEMLAGSHQPRPVPFVEPTIHPSNYRLVMRTKHLLDLSGLSSRLVPIAPRPATHDELTVFHTPEYLDRVRAMSRAGYGDAGSFAPVGPGSYEIALLAAGGAISAIEAVLSGQVRRAFANIRPPGHHALSDRGMGYCLFSNIVVAARYAQQRFGLRRILIVDWDAHHGNGTQAAFYDDPSIVFISLHQDRLYPPDTGLASEVGTGAGTGTTVNLPLPAGSGDATYRAAFERIVLPIARTFAPELLIISAGQDASLLDPEGRMCLTSDAYRWMTSALIGVAEDTCDGRLVMFQEGGYSELYAPYCTLDILESLTACRTHLTEPQDPSQLALRPDVAAVGLTAEAVLGVIEATQACHWPTFFATSQTTSG